MSSTDTLFTTGRVANALNFTNLPISNNLYLFLGGANAFPEDAPLPATNTDYEKLVRQNIFFMQRILLEDMVLVIPNAAWEIGTIYAQYSHSDPLLMTKNFYTIVANNVYKCLSNNGGIPSTHAPTLQSVQPITTADGYQWKFMYNISDTLQANFTIDQYIPVPVGSQKTTQQIAIENAAVEDSESPAGGHGSNAYLELGAFNAMVSKGIDFAKVSNTTINQREFGLLLNPSLINGALATDSFYVIDNNQINLSSGIMIQSEQHDLLTSSSTDSAEIIQIVLSF